MPRGGGGGGHCRGQPHAPVRGGHSATTDAQPAPRSDPRACRRGRRWAAAPRGSRGRRGPARPPTRRRSSGVHRRRRARASAGSPPPPRRARPAPPRASPPAWALARALPTRNPRRARGARRRFRPPHTARSPRTQRPRRRGWSACARFLRIGSQGKAGPSSRSEARPWCCWETRRSSSAASSGPPRRSRAGPLSEREAVRALARESGHNSLQASHSTLSLFDEPLISLGDEFLDGGLVLTIWMREFCWRLQSASVRATSPLHPPAAAAQSCCCWRCCAARMAEHALVQKQR